MAVREPNKRPFLVDRKNNIFVGIDSPIRKSEGPAGYFAATTSVIESVKNNIRNLINTNKGERLMHPSLGMNLRRYLFEQITEENILAIQEEIKETFKRWLPFVIILKIDVKIIEDENYTTLNDFTNALILKIVFSLKNDPDNANSIELGITSTGELSENNDTIGGDPANDEHLP